MKKRLLSLALAGTMAASTMAVGAVNAAAYDDYEGVPGSYCDHPTYTPSSASTKTNRLMFAMPGPWQNDITKNDKDDGLCGAYWWSGYDTPHSQGWSNGWPGWQAEKVDEEGVDNLWAIDVPSYGNGEVGNATMLIWNNFIDGGTEQDPSKNPFYKAAQQIRDFPCQYYSRYDNHETYDILFRYIYMKAFEKAGVDGIYPLDIKSDNFWVEANKLCAVFNGEKWDRLTNDEKTFQVDIVLDDYAPDLSEFGSYEANFFNEDLVGADGIYYKAEEPNGYGESFTFDNMVFVVSLDPNKMIQAPTTNKIAYDGDVYFYYGSGEYGSWPTKELNEQMGGVRGNFTYVEYTEPPIPDPTDIDPSTPVDPYENPKYQAPKWQQDKDDNSIYFYANPKLFRNFNYIYMYLYEHNNSEIFPWGSKKAKMTDEGNGIWSFDLDAKGITLDLSNAYGVIFTADWGLQTCDLIIGSDCLGDIAYCPGSDVENNVDSNKTSRIVKWANADPDIYGNPVCITAIGNVIGNAYWPGDSAYSMFVRFLSSTGRDGIDNAVKFNGKTVQQTIDDTAKALGLSAEEVDMAIDESGRDFDWSGTSGAHSFDYKELSDGTLEITDTFSTAAEVKISQKFKGKTVSAIGDWVFANNKYIQSVTIPDSIKSIGKGAFYNCPSLTEVTVPDSVTSIGANAFEKCLYLESVTLSKNLTEIADETFFDCRRLKNINIPKGVKTVGEEAFYNCRSLNNLVLPNTVKTIGSKDSSSPVGVFEDCRSLKKIVLPQSVSSVESNAFDGCPTTLTLSAVEGSYADGFAKKSSLKTERMGGVTEYGNLLGDINGSITVNIEDVTALQRILCEYKGTSFDENSPKDAAIADVDGNGVVDIKDATVIQRFLAEYLKSF